MGGGRVAGGGGGGGWAGTGWLSAFTSAATHHLILGGRALGWGGGARAGSEDTVVRRL
jgi:hypothetical protein